MTGEGVMAILGFIALQVIQVFYILDNIMFGDTTFSILDIFIAIMFLELIIGYIMRVITTGKSGFGISADDEDDAEGYTPIGGTQEGVGGEDFDPDEPTGAPQ